MTANSTVTSTIRRAAPDDLAGIERLLAEGVPKRLAGVEGPL